MFIPGTGSLHGAVQVGWAVQQVGGWAPEGWAGWGVAGQEGWLRVDDQGAVVGSSACSIR
jgi:hypothetical protein